MAFSGKPKADITWSKDGKEIKEDAHFSMKYEEEKAILIIDKATVADSATYKLTAKNTEGEVSVDVVVNIEAKQIKPT